MLTELHSNLESFDKTKPRTFILVSTVLTWARSKPLDPVRWFFSDVLLADSTTTTTATAAAAAADADVTV